MIVTIKVDIGCYHVIVIILLILIDEFIERRKKKFPCKVKKYFLKLNRCDQKILHINLFFNIYFNLKIFLKKKLGITSNFACNCK